MRVESGAVRAMRCAMFVVAGLAVGSVSGTASAQQSACVYLKPGAGYAAWMRVVSGGYSSEWSDLFAIGQYRCQSLGSIGDGQPYTVQVSALLGSSKVACTPDNVKRVASAPGSVTYLASGTTLHVQCSMPSQEDAASADSSPTPSKEGLAAAEKVKKEGKTIKAPAK
jgi:hypothetical protein